MKMDKQGFKILRQLIADVEGAPYPNVIENELYTIWYEHVQKIAQDALSFLIEFDQDLESETSSEDV
jgi:hypothetical protein